MIPSTNKGVQKTYRKTIPIYVFSYMIDIFQLHMYIEDFFSSFILVTGKKSREEIDRSVYFTKPYILQRN